MKYYKTLILSLIAALPLAPVFAGSNDTASYYRAHFEDYTGKSVSLDVAFIRVLPVNIGDGYFAFIAMTFDDKNNSGGGAIAVVAPADQKDSIVSKYGTTVEREGKRDRDTKKLRGTLQSVTSAGGIKYTPYVDMTDGAFKPNEAFTKVALGAKDNKRKGGRLF